MKDNYYITQDGILKRKQNTVYFVNKDGRRILPVDRIYTIFAHGKITFSSGVVSYLCKKGVPIHFFNKYGFYEGSLYPRETLVSGDLLVRQANHYLDMEKRLYLASEIIKGCGANIIKNLQYYGRTKDDFTVDIATITKNMGRLDAVESIEEILSIEGNNWDTYYKCFDRILPEKFKFEQRTRKPPENMVNSMISFGNSLLYSTILTELYHTQLNPTISFLHQPSDRRFSLSLDLAEVFRPLLVDRTIFKLLNKNMLSEKNFDKELNCCLLNDSGRRTFLENWDERLNKTIRHKNLGRKVSYKRLIRLECYKLIKHFLGEKNYKAFRIWW
ncbi:MAG TPA: type I-B CRISPR-associated endonuclease Cas1 [Candidatus Altiarchaeales archaeon]|nr:type I-B CRISPR-associated endonuclease Cas1 [Candidatus Altiarchaeales archaeon]